MPDDDADPSRDFDPTRALDGWRPRADRHDEHDDPTRALDGWRADGAVPPRSRGVPGAEDARIVVELPRTPTLPVALPDIAMPSVEGAEPIGADDLRTLGRSASRFAASQFDAEDVDARWQPSQPLAVRKRRVPGVLDAWQPGAWIAAMRPVSAASAEVVETPQGPVVETYPPHLLLALWPPQTSQSPSFPFLGRWPAQVCLSAVEADAAAESLLPLLPAGAELWLAEPEALDWASLGELVLLHDAGLRTFQLKALRAFVDGERDAAFRRLNDDFGQPAPGAPVQRKPA